MLTAVWGAVIAVAVAFVIGIGVAVYVMLKAARLMTESSATLASLREREDALITRASTAIDQVGEQIAKTETIAASMDDVTASMAELRGRITALAGGQAAPGHQGGALTWTAALAYGLARALGLRWAARYRLTLRRSPGAGPAGATPVTGRRPTAPPAPVTGRRPTAPPAPVTGRRWMALTGRRDGESR
jgi:hypothetical protein